ncbi:NAD(P)H dehydrogenase (quinone) [Mycobacterium sp. OAS707]|uniref:NAD(P)H-binding protein n=1 Tax=Mycobacterium sp. OAS707 TaxID=2663822 RepID=UPI00178A554B|nr:NAD(P)H-binding protein [Mycobacterium sp. OAS707]MBE1548565.1 NAD(P)H dehydrogenase (quinone) [Mycobacterium sp. OAS707]
MTVIGITGASGTLGRRTAQYVLDAHPPQDVVLFSRTPASLAEYTAAGAEARQADFNRPDSLVESFSGVDVLLLISTDAVGQRRSQHEAAIAAAAAGGVTRIAYTSLANADKEFPAKLRPLSDDHAATEEALRAAGPSWTLLRNALYLDGSADSWAHAVTTGTLITNNGSGRQAPITREDCAAAAAAVLLTDGHDEAVYEIAGQCLLDDVAIAAALTAVHGRPVEPVGVTDDDYESGLLAAGLPTEIASMLTGFGQSIRAGLLETRLGDTERLIGRTPTSIEQFLAAHLESNPQRRQ